MGRENPTHQTDRRSFLKTSAAGLVAGALAGCTESESPLAGKSSHGTGQKGDDLLVVGGGLCGLSLLDAWTQIGKQARLIEASDRLGGRIYTLREGLSRGLRFEAGAERIPRAHLRLRQLIGRLNLETRPYLPPESRTGATLHWNGSHRFHQATDLPKALMNGLSSLEQAGFPHLIAGELAAAAGEEGLQRAQRLTGWDWLKQIGMSKAAEPFVRAFCPYPLHTLPAPQLRRFLLREHGFGADVATISGGTDQITAGLATLHRSKIMSGAAVTQVEQSETGVTVTLKDGSAVTASLVAFCIPPKRLLDIDFGASRPRALDQRIRVLSVENEIKVGLEIAGEFANADAPPIGLWAFRPSFPRVTWTLPERTANGSRVMQAMAVLEDLQQAAPAVAEGPAGIRRLMGQEAPEIAQAAGVILGHDFASGPQPSGAWTWSHSGNAPSEAESALRVGRLVFAGSDFTRLSGWMEGALLSAETAMSMLQS